MTEPVVTPPAGDPPAGGTPPAPAPTPKPAAAAADVLMTSDQLKTRLDESRAAGEAALIKSLGFKKADDLKAVLKTAKDIADAELSESQRLKKQVETLEPEAKKAERLGTLVTSIVNERFGKLPEATQRAIDARANGDPEERLALMQMLEAAGPIAPATPPAVTPPPTVGAPPAPPAGGQLTKFQEFEQIKAKSPVLGDVFYQSNMREIEATRPPAK